MQKPIIRKAQLIDLDSAYDVIHECALLLRSKGMNNWERYTKAKVRDMLLSDEVFVLTIDDNVMGTVKISPQAPAFYTLKDIEKYENADSMTHYFTALAVSPRLQGKGYGSMLIDFTEEYAKKQSAEYIRMTMFSKNKALKAYYIKRNFNFRQERYIETLGLTLSFGEKRLSNSILQE